MTITAWRIVKKRHAGTVFSGTGARRFGGRWNSPGVTVIYAAETLALAALETLVHLRGPELLHRYFMASIAFDEQLVQVVDKGKLPPNWRSDPPPATVCCIGDEWVESKSSAVLKVPSAIIEMQYNYLLNPAHPDFGKCVLGKPAPLQFDPRLKK